MAKKRRTPEEEEHTDETWLIPYADILTLLLALFIVLFASSQIDSQKFDDLSRSLSGAFSGGFNFFQHSPVVPINDELLDVNVDRGETNLRHPISGDHAPVQEDELLEQIQQETIDLEKLKRQLDEYIAEEGLDTELETQLNHQQLMITIRDTALFASGSAIIKQEAQHLAIAIATMLEQYPQYEIKISGHTDDVPMNTTEFPSNWELSSGRAVNFMKILLDNSVSDPSRFSATGYSEYRPIATNDTSDGRTRNRRVEVSIIRNFISDPQIINVQEQP